MTAISTSAPFEPSPARHTTPPAAWIGALLPHYIQRRRFRRSSLRHAAAKSLRAFGPADVLALEQPAGREVDVAGTASRHRRTARSSPRPRRHPAASPSTSWTSAARRANAFACRPRRRAQRRRHRLGRVARLLGALAHVVEVLVGARVLERPCRRAPAFRHARRASRGSTSRAGRSAAAVSGGAAAASTSRSSRLT